MFWHFSSSDSGASEGIRVGAVAVKTNTAGYEVYPYVWMKASKSLEVMNFTYNAFNKSYFFVEDCSPDDDSTIHEELQKESDRANDLLIEQAQQSIATKAKKKVAAENLKSQCNGKCDLGVKYLATIKSQTAELKKLRSDAKSASTVTSVSTGEVKKLKESVARLTTQLATATAKIKVKATGSNEVSRKTHDDLDMKYTSLF